MQQEIHVFFQPLVVWAIIRNPYSNTLIPEILAHEHMRSSVKVGNCIEKQCAHTATVS